MGWTTVLSKCIAEDREDLVLTRNRTPNALVQPRRSYDDYKKKSVANLIAKVLVELVLFSCAPPERYIIYIINSNIFIFDLLFGPRVVVNLIGQTVNSKTNQTKSSGPADPDRPPLRLTLHPAVSQTCQPCCASRLCYLATQADGEDHSVVSLHLHLNDWCNHSKRRIKHGGCHPPKPSSADQFMFK